MTMIGVPTDPAMPLRWDGGLIVVSYFIAVQAAYTAVQILQLRVSRWLVVLGAFCLSTSGIWSMHFLGMAAVSIDASTTYDAGWTVASACFAFVPCAVALLLVHHKVDYVETDDAGLAANLDALRRAPHGWIGLSGVLIALGVCAMHYTGMHAMRTETAHVMDWGVLAASCFIALFAASAALYFAFVLPLTRKYTVPTSLVAGVAVCGMHYTGMYAMEYHLAENRRHLGGYNALFGAAVYIAFGASFVNFSALALTSHFYRSDSKAAELRARAGVALSSQVAEQVSRYDMDGALVAVTEANAAAECDPRLHEQLHAMLTNLEPYRAYLPQSLFAVASSVDTEDEGDIGTDALGASNRTGATASTSGRPDDYDDDGQASAVSHTNLQSSTLTLSRKTLASSDCSGAGGSSSSPGLPFHAVTSKSTNRRPQRRSLTPGDGGGIEVLQTSHLIRKPIAVLVVNVRGFHQSLARGGFVVGERRQAALLAAVQAHVPAQRGVVDYFQGDHVVASWNAVTSVSMANARACAAALAVLGERPADLGGAGVTCGLGFGPAIVGNMGIKEVKRFCMIGDVVKDAHVLERLAKRYACDVKLDASCADYPGQASRILFDGKHYDDLSTTFFAQFVDVVRLPSSAGRPCLLASLEAKKCAAADEWMYQLQQGEREDPFAVTNAAFSSLLTLAVRFRNSTGSPARVGKTSIVDILGASDAHPAERHSLIQSLKTAETIAMDALKTADLIDNDASSLSPLQPQNHHHPAVMVVVAPSPRQQPQPSQKQEGGVESTETTQSPMITDNFGQKGLRSVLERLCAYNPNLQPSRRFSNKIHDFQKIEGATADRGEEKTGGKPDDSRRLDEVIMLNLGTFFDVY